MCRKATSNVFGKLPYSCLSARLTLCRLILYFPVSALVTLFGNILQNPQDPRARSDVRLMNLVVNFLSMLITEEENGGVKRMLGVCSEFERIAKVVLDKAEKDSSSRRKRKNQEDQTKSKAAHQQQQQQQQQQHQQQIQAQNTMAQASANAIASVFSPNLGAQPPPNGFGSSPMNGNTNMNSGSPNWQADFGNGSEYMTPNANGMNSYPDMGYSNGNEMLSPFNSNSFQQPFVPQDLWQMPMTLEYDWADMTGGTYPSFENGLLGDPNQAYNNNQHLQHRQM
jgi:hypothetical protein